MKYFFILGRNPTLSFAELIAFLTHHNISHHVENVSKEVVLIKTEEIISDTILEKLGGSVKFGIVIAEIGWDEKTVAFERILSSDFLLPHIPSKAGKIHLGISVYESGANQKDVVQFSSQLKHLNKTIKAHLQEGGRSVGFVQIKERFLSSVSVAKNELLTAGIEIVFLLGEDALLMGKTCAVQAFESFRERDMERPAKDKRSGILPPKLARMMINLVQLKSDSTILDPFCGSGTVIQEALSLGFSHVLGSDISQKAVADTRKNIDWLRQRFYGDVFKISQVHIFHSDIHMLSQNIAPSSVEAIVTEPYLGPPLFQKPDVFMVKKIFGNITPLYQALFIQAHKILKKRGRMVVIFPCFEVQGTISFLNIEEKIQSHGFCTIPLLPNDIVSPVFYEYTARGSIVYGGKEQFVKREIRCFELL